MAHTVSAMALNVRVISMYILKRTISPYTGSDLLLGCFRDFRQARETRDYYIQQYKSNKKDDPWRGQAFHDVDLEKDVVLLDDIAEYDILAHETAVMAKTLLERLNKAKELLAAKQGTSR